ncbi:MAG: autotransporter-associated beta strand repeat-containing protein [Luteibacter sp.]|uniref:autotransporter-associated beta strand repeat-containing protein n=1 Tax=Luteibacter sp. TaxID=1886636 RepID=UPI00280962F4|nr:autotransporter-associated beta strand repeat-containing protein [Luteibacter sp.]MDQ7996272.1 autotransporter-associated beta strand repeat-containing protein [Luteibacter sp.]MDQ8049473.1 autotransporter-associated beta strand repeat-containing protein [Luteibacter sp.]
MNRTYRLVWNRALRVVQVASELSSSEGAAADGTNAAPPRMTRLFSALLAAGLCLSSAVVFAQNAAPGGSGNSAAAGRVLSGAGGAGNGTGGQATHVGSSFDASVIDGASANNGVGGSGASGIDDPEGATGVGGAGGAVGAPGTVIVGGRGGDGSTGHAPGGGGGGGAGVYTTATSYNVSATTITGGAGGHGGGQDLIAGGAGGGGGGAGLVSGVASGFVLNLSAGQSITGGAGGAGGAGSTTGVSVGGGGGGGGDGVLITGTAGKVTNANGATITGGVGGAAGGGNSASGGSGASGAGIRALASGLHVTNNGTIAGGAATGNGAAGNAIVTQDSADIENYGTLAGGAFTGGHASALLFNGAGNVLGLHAGTVIQGAIELASNASASIVADAAVSLNGVTLDGGTADVVFNATNGGSIDLGGDLTGTGTVRSTGVGSLTLDNVNLTGSLALSHTGGTHTAGTVQTTGAQTYLGGVTLDGATLFSSASNIGFNGVTAGTDALSVTAGGTITASGVVTLGGSSVFTALGHDITMTNAGNRFAGLLTATGRNIAIASNSALSVGPVSATGNVTLTGTAITLQNDLQATGTLTLTGDSVTQTAGGVVVGTLTGSTTGDFVLASTNNAIATLGNLTAQNATLAGATPVNITGTVNVQSLALSSAGRSVLTGTLTSTGNITLQSGTELAVGGGGTTGALTGNVVDNGTLSFNRSNNVSFTGDLSGAGALVKNGAGKLLFDGDGSGFTGNTTVSAGSLIVGSAANSTAVLGGPNGAGAGVTVNGSGTLGGHGTIATNVDVLSGGTLSPGNSVGTLTVDGNLTLEQGSTLQAEFGGLGSGDQVVVSGNLALNGATLNVVDAGGMTNGVYNLFSTGGTLSTSNGGLVLGTTPPGHPLTLQYLTSFGQVNLIDNSTSNLSFWNANGLASATQMGGGTGVWSTTAPNWTDATGTQPNGQMSPQPGFAIFGGAAGTVTVDGTPGQLQATGMQFLTDGYTLTGDSVQLLTTDGTTPIIRVGDGTASSAPYTATVSSVLTGNQGMEKADAGTLVLTAANTYTGNTVVSGGTLAVSADNNLGDAANGVTLQGGTLGITGTSFTTTDRALTLASGTGGTLAVADAGNVFNWHGGITGAGTLTVQGPGTLLLDHANSYTGDTVVNGTLQLAANGAIGTGALVLNGGSRVALYAPGTTLANSVVVGGETTLDTGAGTATLTGAVSSAAGSDTSLDIVHKTGTGTLLLANAVSLGAVNIDAGTLQIGNGATSGSLAGNVVNNGALVFQRADNTSFGGVLSGAGTVSKLGAGNLQLTGDSSAFAGSTTVSSGSLQVDGSLGGSLTFASGTTFTGNGTAGNVTLQSGSILSPGGAGIGKLATAGDLTVAAGTQYSLDLDNTGHSDMVSVGGKATLQGGSVVSLASAAGKWSPTATYTILTAANGVSGTFSNVSSNLAFLTPQLAYTANAVNLTLTRNDILFADIGATRNQKATAAAIESIGEDQPVFDTVVKLDAASARRAYDQLSGEIHANLQGAIADDDRYKREAINQHLLTQFADETEDSFATWASAWGHRGHHDEDGNASKLDASGSGVFVGADKGIADRSRIGVALGSGRVSADARDDSASGNTLTAAIYGGADFGDVMIQAGGIYSRYDIDTHRTVDVDSLAGRLSGTTKAHSLQGFVEGSYEFRWDSGALAPFLNITQQQLRTNSSDERGSNAALHVMGNKSDLTYGTLGVRGRKDFGEDGRFGIFGSVGWQHAAGDTDTSSKQRFLEGGNVFEVMGTPVGKNAGVGVFGVRFLATPTVTIDASWNGQFASEAKDQSARLALNWVF